MQLEEFKKQLKPDRKYIIEDHNGEVIYKGAYLGSNEVLTVDKLDGILAEHPNAHTLTVGEYIKNGYRKLAGGNAEQNYRRDKPVFTVQVSDQPEQNTPTPQQTENSNNQNTQTMYQPPQQPPQQPNTPQLSGLGLVFSNPAASEFMYKELERAKEKLEREVIELKKELKEAENKVQEMRLNEINHTQKVARMEDEIKKKQEELTDSKGWADKLGTLMSLAKEDPQGTQVMMGGVASAIKDTFFGGNMKGLSGPMNKNLSEIKQWMDSSSEEAQNALMKMFIAIVTHSIANNNGNPEEAFINNATKVTSMFPSQQQSQQAM